MWSLNELFFASRLIELSKSADAEVSEDLIKAQSVIFFAAGFETTANTLTTLSYILAKYPETQVTNFSFFEEIYLHSICSYSDTLNSDKMGW